MGQAQDSSNNYEYTQYDDCISRAYYAVFHAISAVLLSKGLHFSSHTQTIGAFNRDFVKTDVFPREFTREIQKLFNERQTGDYDYGNLLDVQTADADIATARRIIEACESYLETQGLYKKQ